MAFDSQSGRSDAMAMRDNLLSIIEKLRELMRMVLDRNISDERNQDQIDDLTNELNGLPLTILWTLPETEVYRLLNVPNRMV